MGITKGRRRKKNQLKLVHKLQAHDNVSDRISQLPDDILASIVSRLTLREATATSLLSRRWRPLHTLVSRLNFPPFFSELDTNSLAQKKFRKYVKMVSHTLNSYKGGRILKEFRVHMLRTYETTITNFLGFALSREVEIIDIHATRRIGVDKRGDYYSLRLENLIKSGQGLKCLRELSLFRVYVDDADFKLLVSNFPNLESLSVEYTHKLRNISIVGHPKLQRLNISHTNEVEFIEIKDLINLVSLRCFRLRVHPFRSVVQFNNLPKLIEFDTFEDSIRGIMHNLLQNLPSCICSQLLVVRFSATSQAFFAPSRHHPYLFPAFINVKHLELELKDPTKRVDIWVLVQLFIACHFLEKLEMKCEWDHATAEGVEFGVRDKVQRHPLEKDVSPKLKKVKLSGYLGCVSELMFALFVLENAPSSLQELIVERCCASDEIRQLATANVRDQLQPIIPNSLNFLLI